MSAAVVLFVAGSLLAAPITPPAPGCTACPTPWLVHSSTSADNSINIVFLSDGFTVATLETYRCAVESLTDDLLAAEPWKSLACHINVYRLDFVSESGGIPADCPTACERTDVLGDELASWCPRGLDLGTPIGGGDCPVAWRAFGTHACERNTCRLLWPSETGEDDALSMASSCTPSRAPVAAVVVAASLVGRGGGDSAAGEKPGLAVVDLGDMGRATGQSLRLSHELGHAFGLLDEYSGSPVEIAPEYQCGRNLFREPPPNTLDERDPVWMGECEAPSTTCTGCPPAHNCSRVCCPTSGCNVQGSPTIGLYEGGFYQDCGYWHAASSCQMEGGVKPFCPVCTAYVYKKAGWAGEVACEPPSSELPRVAMHLDKYRKTVLLLGCPRWPPPPPRGLGSDRSGSKLPRDWVAWPTAGPCGLAPAGSGAWWATVEMDGVIGEVPVRSARIPIVTADGREGLLELSGVGEGTGARTVWQWSGREIRPEDEFLRKGPDGSIVLGRLRGKAEVVDDVRGDRWSALSIRRD